MNPFDQIFAAIDALKQQVTDLQAQLGDAATVKAEFEQYKTDVQAFIQTERTNDDSEVAAFEAAHPN